MLVSYQAHFHTVAHLQSSIPVVVEAVLIAILLGGFDNKWKIGCLQCLNMHFVLNLKKEFTFIRGGTHEHKDA